MATGTQLTVQSSAIAPWSSRQDVRELSNRIKEMLPGGQRLQPGEALALAQVAVAHNLDPFNGEVWFIPGRGLMAGIKGHRRAGHIQMEREGGGNYWCEFDGPLSVDQLRAYRMPEKALAFRCRLYDTKNINTYVSSVKDLLAAGMPWEVVEKVMGSRPYTEGFGYWVEGEQTKMTPVQCAQKRAEAEALKRRFDLPFEVGVGTTRDADFVEGDFVAATEPPEDIQERRKAGSAALYGDDDQGPAWPSEHEAQPAPSPAQPTPNGVTKARAATIHTPKFGVWAAEWAPKHAAYADHSGQKPNMYHILATVGKLGFDKITEANLQDVISALDSHAAGKVDEQRAA